VRFAQKSAIKPNEQKGACSHFAMAERIVEENLTNLFKSGKKVEIAPTYKAQKGISGHFHSIKNGISRNIYSKKNE